MPPRRKPYLAIGGLIGALVLIPAAPAQAHATLLTSAPAAGYSVSRSPAELTLVFDEPISIRGTPIRVSGGSVTLAPPRLSHGGRWLTARLVRPLAAGQYAVSWQVVADDGDVVGGNYRFGVGVPAAAGGSTATHGLIWAAILRWMLFAALSVALGGLAGQRITRRVVRKAAAVGAELPPVRAPVRVAGAVGALAAIGLSLHAAGSIAAVWTSSAGRVGAVEVVAFAVAAALARVPVPAAVALLVVVAAEGQRSHLREIDGGLGTALLVVHLAAAAIWLGALSHVIAVAWRWRANRAAAHRVFAEYAKLALALLLFVATSGALSAVVALPSASALATTGYGRLLVVKILLVAVVVGCAVAARNRVRLASPLRADRPAERLPGRAARTERILLTGVLAVTALLVSVAVPGRADTGTLAFPPPPDGPVVRLATLAGEVTVDVAASDGQLEVRTSVPDPGGEGGGDATRVSARLGPRTVALRRCGPGCFVGPAQWTRGANTLAVTAASRKWAGGSATFAVPWPPATDARLLARVVAAMRATPAVTVRETVTSNTAGPAPIATTHTLTGADFASVEPYGDAGPLDVTVLSGTEFAFALPGQGYYFRLRVAADRRIVAEVITTPQHLYTRTFDYPKAR